MSKSNPLEGKRLFDAKKTEITEIEINNYPSARGTLNLTYRKTVTPTTGGEAYETVMGKEKPNEDFILKLTCNNTEVYKKTYSDLVKASADFNTLYKTLNPNA